MPEHIRCNQCAHLIKLSGRMLYAKCPLLNIYFLAAKPPYIHPDPETFYCKFAEEKK